SVTASCVPTDPETASESVQGGMSQMRGVGRWASSASDYLHSLDPEIVRIVARDQFRDGAISAFVSIAFLAIDRFFPIGTASGKLASDATVDLSSGRVANRVCWSGASEKADCSPGRCAKRASRIASSA